MRGSLQPQQIEDAPPTKPLPTPGLETEPQVGYLPAVPRLERITMDAAVMGGRPCIRGMRVTVGTVVGLVAAGKAKDEIHSLYPYLEAADVDQAPAYAAWRAEEREVAVAGA